MASGLSPDVIVLRRPNRGLFIVLTLSLAILILLLALRSSTPPALYFLLAAIYLGWALDALYRRLTVTPDGLVYRRLLSTTTVRWEDIRTIVSEGTLSRQETLLVQPAGARPIRIPISYFSRTWRNDRLGKILKDKAPHIFER
jgi:hypothetical protein